MEINEKVRNFLIKRAKDSSPISYQNLSDECELGLDMSMTNHRKQIGKILGDISTHEYNAGRPLLSVVVVHKNKTGLGKGFFNLCQNLGLKCGESDAEKETFAQQKRIECYSYWKTHGTIL